MEPQSRDRASPAGEVESLMVRQTNIIRTGSSKLETGSDYFFSSIMITSATEQEREAPLAHARNRIIVFQKQCIKIACLIEENNHK